MRIFTRGTCTFRNKGCQFNQVQITHNICNQNNNCICFVPQPRLFCWPQTHLTSNHNIQGIFLLKIGIHKSRFKRVLKPLSISEGHIEKNINCPTTPPDKTWCTFTSQADTTWHSTFIFKHKDSQELWDDQQKYPTAQVFKGLYLHQLASFIHVTFPH